MCLPAAALAIAATAVSAIGTGVGALNSAAQSRYQARVADRNATLENQAARDAIERGQLEARNYQRQLSQQQGAQRAALAANGIDTSYGTAALVQRDLASVGAADTQTIRENAMREARGLEINAANYRASAAASRSAASAALVEGAFGVASTVLGGAQQYKKIQWNQRNPAGRNPFG